MNVNTARFETALARISRGLRLRFDRRKRLYVIEQRDHQGYWCSHHTVKTESGSFRRPNNYDLEFIRRRDWRRYSIDGKLNLWAWDKFIDEEFNEPERQHDAKKNELIERATEDFKDRMAYVYKKHWRKFGNYTRKQVNDVYRRVPG